MANNNPWAEVGNQAVGALYKHYMSKPNPMQMEQMALQNRLMDARLGTEAAQGDFLRSKTMLNNRRLDSAEGLAGLVSGFYDPVEMQGPMPDGSAIPLQQPTQEIIDDRFREGRGDLMSSAANFAIANPGDFAKVLGGFYSGAGAPVDMTAPLQDAGDLSAPVKNFKFRGTLTDPEDVRVYDSYVRANQKYDLGDVIQNVSGATGQPIESYGVGIEPERTVDAKGRQIIISPGVPMGNRPPVNNIDDSGFEQPMDVGGSALPDASGPLGVNNDLIDPLNAHQSAVTDRQGEIGTNQYQNSELGGTSALPDGSVVTPMALSPEQQRKKDEKDRIRNIQGDLVNDDISRALNTVTENPTLTTGLGGVPMGWVPGSDAYNLDKTLETIKANIGFDKLQTMRDSSPTGGALGQVSEFENRLLQSVFGSLERSQSDKQLRYNLMRLQNVYNDIVHGPQGGSERHAIPMLSNIGEMTTPEELDSAIKFFEFDPPEDISRAIVQRANQLGL